MNLIRKQLFLTQLASIMDGLVSDIGCLGGVWRPLGDVLAVLEEILGVLEAFGSLLGASWAALEGLGGLLEASWKGSWGVLETPWRL